MHWPPPVRQEVLEKLAGGTFRVPPRCNSSGKTSVMKSEFASRTTQPGGHSLAYCPLLSTDTSGNHRVGSIQARALHSHQRPAGFRCVANMSDSFPAPALLRDPVARMRFEAMLF